jgi:hypothetical protein
VIWLERVRTEPSKSESLDSKTRFSLLYKTPSLWQMWIKMFGLRMYLSSCEGARQYVQSSVAEESVAAAVAANTCDRGCSRALVFLRNTMITP